MPAAPVVYVKSVPIQSEWMASPVGWLRNDPTIYECPIFQTALRGPTYITTATLLSGGSNEKWTLSGVALLMEKAI
eukprot:scaffold13464_cov33-Cyclotella_meneghiniana.AAC.3